MLQPSIKHILAQNSAHAHEIVVAYVLKRGFANIEESNGSLIMFSGFSQNNYLLAVITWDIQNVESRIKNVLLNKSR